MYLVSSDYKAAMRAQVREAATHATIYFGVFDHTAQPDAMLSWSDAVWYADPANISGGSAVTTSYATFEPGQLRLDGSQKLLPQESEALQAQGFVSAERSNADGTFANPPTICCTFSKPHSMVGLTLEFDGAYDLPAQFTVVSLLGGEIVDEKTVSENITRIFKGEFLLDGIDQIRIRFDKMRVPGSRTRLNGIKYGIGYVYSDHDLQKLTEKHTGSPLALSLPVSSLVAELFDDEGRFSVDGDTDLQRFLADGQKSQVVYSVDCGETTQEVPGGTWYLAKWDVAGIVAKFTFDDLMTRLNKTRYEKSIFTGEPRSLYELALDVCVDAGLAVDEFYIDSALKSVFSSAPLPIVSHAVALQLIANAGQCRLYVGRENTVRLERLKISVNVTGTSSTPQTIYSDPSSVTDEVEVSYATFEPGFNRVDGSLRLLPSTGNEFQKSGWVGLQPSDANGVYGANELVLNFSDVTNIYHVQINWGNTPPLKARLWCRVDGVWTSSTEIRPSANEEMYAVQFVHCDAVKIELLQAKVAGQRPRVLRANASTVTDFNLTDDQLFHGKKSTMETKLRNVISSFSSFSMQPDESEIASTTAQANAGWIRLEHDLCAAPTVSVENENVAVESIQYAYVTYIRLTADEDVETKVTIRGNKINCSQTQIVAAANVDGEDIELENQLLTSREVAQGAADWVRDYYSSRITYEDSLRGFPELDMFDAIYLQSGCIATINHSELTYNGAMNQKLKLRQGGA